MSQDNWRTEVASLLAEAARAVASKQDRRALRLVGTLLAYLERLRARGEQGADELLRELRESEDSDHTTRFRFVPGENEEIERRSKIP